MLFLSVEIFEQNNIRRTEGDSLVATVGARDKSKVSKGKAYFACERVADVTERERRSPWYILGVLRCITVESFFTVLSTSNGEIVHRLTRQFNRFLFLNFFMKIRENSDSFYSNKMP